MGRGLAAPPFSLKVSSCKSENRFYRKVGKMKSWKLAVVAALGLLHEFLDRLISIVVLVSHKDYGDYRLVIYQENN